MKLKERKVSTLWNSCRYSCKTVSQLLLQKLMIPAHSIYVLLLCSDIM
uniref:Uncharacterized protein n=1 Tax=Rhizophora mucronata TaxID=61149 RepID=A0A2P2NMX0_RHIMU